MKTPIFNADQLLQSLAGDKELALELLDAFLIDSSARSQSLHEALASGNIEEVTRLAHSLKGMCGVARADVLVEFALLMEGLARDGDLARVEPLYAEFAQKLTIAHDEIRAFAESD